MKQVRQLLAELRSLTEADEDVRTLEREVRKSPHDGPLQQRLIAAYGRGGLTDPEARAKAAVFYVTKAGVHPGVASHRGPPSAEPKTLSQAMGPVTWEAPYYLLDDWGSQMKLELKPLVERGDTKVLDQLGFKKDPHFTVRPGVSYRSVKQAMHSGLVDKGVRITSDFNQGPDGRVPWRHRRWLFIIWAQGLLLQYYDIYTPAGSSGEDDDDETVASAGIYTHPGP